MSIRDRIFKIVLIGDGGVGKTSIRRRYFGEKFETNYSMTLGADFSVKNDIVDNRRYVLQIWDLAGQPRFEEVRTSYYKGLSGIILVFDVTRPESFLNIPLWFNEVQKHSNQDARDIPIVILGNKIDLRGNAGSQLVSEEQAIEYCNTLDDWSNQNVNYFETSALTNVNIEKAFRQLIRNLEKKYDLAG